MAYRNISNRRGNMINMPWKFMDDPFKTEPSSPRYGKMGRNRVDQIVDTLKSKNRILDEHLSMSINVESSVSDGSDSDVTVLTPTHYNESMTEESGSSFAGFDEQRIKKKLKGKQSVLNAQTREFNDLVRAKIPHRDV